MKSQNQQVLHFETKATVFCKGILSFQGSYNQQSFNEDPNTAPSLGTLTPKNLQEIAYYKKIKTNSYGTLKQILQCFAEENIICLEVVKLNQFYHKHQNLHTFVNGFYAFAFGTL